MPKYKIEIIKRGNDGRTFIVEAVQSYKIEQAVDVPADAFNITVPNIDGAVSDAVSPGDFFNFYFGDKRVMRGIIDDFDLNLSNKTNDVTISGRDYMSLLLDNNAAPKTLYNLGLNDYLGKVMPEFNIPYSADNNEKFDKIVIDPGDTEYSVIEKLCDKRNLTPIFDSDGKFKCTKITSSQDPRYHFSNDLPDTIKFTDITIKISNDIVNEVEIYAVNPNSDEKDMSEEEKKKKNINGKYRDPNLITKKKKVMNDSDVDKVEDANRMAKQEFFKVNKNAFTIDITTNNKDGHVIPINTTVRVSIKRFGLDCLLYVDSVDYSRDTSSDKMSVSLKLIPGVRVQFKGKDIPTLPII